MKAYENLIIDVCECFTIFQWEGTFVYMLLVTTVLFWLKYLFTDVPSRVRVCC